MKSSRLTRSASSSWVVAALLALAAPAQPQQQQYPTLGHALFAAGFTEVLIIDHMVPYPPGCVPGESCTGASAVYRRYPYNPNAVLLRDRFGYGDNGHMGSVVGERASRAPFECYVRAGLLPGFGSPTYDATLEPLFADTWYVGRPNQRPVYETMAATFPHGCDGDEPPSPEPTATPAPTPRATPAPCPAGCSRISFGGCACPTATPAPIPQPTATPCASPPPCPTCGPAEAHVIERMPAEVAATLRAGVNALGKRWSASKAAALAWIDGHRRVYVPSPRSTGDSGAQHLEVPR